MHNRVLRLSLLHVQNHSARHGFLDGETRHALKSILGIFLDQWKIFKEQERQREEEEGSLFKFKNKTHGSNLTEDEENRRSVSRAFPSFDGEFKDIMAPQDLNDNDATPQMELEPSPCVPASDSERFMANMSDFSEIRRIHEEMFCQLPSRQDTALGWKDRCPYDSVDSLYLEAFQWTYQTAALVNAIIPCKFPLFFVRESVIDLTESVSFVSPFTGNTLS